jgi:predicted esterase
MPSPSRSSILELDGPGERIPAILRLPTVSTPVPGALLIHGLSSRKERMDDTIGRALAEHGIAALSIDLPLHGQRDRGALERMNAVSAKEVFALIASWRLALAEARIAIDSLASHRAIDANRLALVGYSLGAFLGIHVAAEQPRIAASVLVAGGDLPSGIPFIPMIRTVADPRRAAKRYAGRPLLMINGRLDRAVTVEQARGLHAAAGEPKEVRWYEGGHWPPTTEVQYAAQWLAGRLPVPEVGRRTAR